MQHRLGWIAFGGIAVGALCLAVAGVTGGRSIFHHLDGIGGYGDWDSPGCGIVMTGHDDTRSIDWNGGDDVRLEIPATVHYKRGAGDRLTMRGDAALLSRVVLEQDGRIRFNCRVHHPGTIDVTLPGRDFKSYSMKGSGDITLDGIDQPTLEINVAGNSDVTVSGKTDKLEYNLAGAGDAKLAGLDVSRAELNIAGHGDTEINARDSLEVNIAGHGDVKLITEPHHIETNIFGAGEIVHPDGDVSSTHGAGSTSH